MYASQCKEAISIYLCDFACENVEMGDTKVGMSRAYTPGLDLLMVTHKEHLRQVKNNCSCNIRESWAFFLRGGVDIFERACAHATY